MKPKLIIVTGNSLKFRELSNELSNFFDCEQGTIDGFEIQGTPEEILEYKLIQAFHKFKQPVLVDDASLHIEDLGGFPGAYVRDFLTALNPIQTGEKFEGSNVIAICHLGICFDVNNFLVAKGEVNGTIVKPTQKEFNDYNFDVFFLPSGMDKVMSEFSPEEKNKFSHRGNAMRDLISKLNKLEN